VQEEPTLDFQDTGFNPKEYFQSTVGIIVQEEKPQHIVLRFSTKQGKYILTQPIHESQEVVEITENFIKVALDVVPNYELYSIFLGWGNQVEVLEPAEMREQMKRILKGTLVNY